MIAHLNLDDRLSILRVNDSLRNWISLDDQRICVLCERKFKGRQVEVRRSPGARVKRCCPTLGVVSTPQQWHYTMRPVSSHSGKKHWRRVLPNKRYRRQSGSTLRMEACRV